MNIHKHPLKDLLINDTDYRTQTPLTYSENNNPSNIMQKPSHKGFYMISALKSPSSKTTTKLLK